MLQLTSTSDRSRPFLPFTFWNVDGRIVCVVQKRRTTNYKAPKLREGLLSVSYSLKATNRRRRILLEIERHDC